MSSKFIVLDDAFFTSGNQLEGSYYIGSATGPRQSKSSLIRDILANTQHMIPTNMFVSPPHQRYWSLPPPAAQARIPVLKSIPPEEDKDASFAYAILQALGHQRENIVRLERHGKLPGNSEHDSAEGALGGTQWSFRKFLDPTLKGPVFGTITRVEMDAFVAKFLANYV